MPSHLSVCLDSQVARRFFVRVESARGAQFGRECAHVFLCLENNSRSRSTIASSRSAAHMYVWSISGRGRFFDVRFACR